MKFALKLSLVVVLGGVLACWLTHPVYAESRQVYTGTIDLKQTDWVGALRFPRFDINQGILTGVEFVLDARLEGSAEFESLDAQQVYVTVGMSANVQLQRPSGAQILEAVPETAITELVEPFDQEIDYSGPSGRVFPQLIDIEIVESEAFSDPADLNLFTGEDPIELLIAASGRASGTGGGNLALNYVTQVSALISVTYLYEAATIDLEKFTNGEDADTAPGVLLQVGDPITWTYMITNTGAVDLVELTLEDDQEGAISCPSTALAAGASMTCTLRSASNAQPRQYTNLATVTALTVDDGVNLRRTATDSDPSNYFAHTISLCPVDNNGLVILPSIVFLGMGAGVYVRPDGYETFIVKRRATLGIPFKFETDPGQRNSQGQYVLEAANTIEGKRQRFWACSGDCDFVAHLDGPVDIGFIEEGLTIGAVVIDDDNDVRINKWVAENNGVITDYPIEVQTMVEYLTFTIPQSANWSYFAADSVGIVDLCLVPPKAQFVARTANHGAALTDADHADNLLFLPTVFSTRR